MCNQVFPRIIMIIFFSAGLSALTYAQIAVKSSNATTSTYDYTMIDQYALVVPQSAQQSITSLAAYLSKKATNEREKARSIFIWVGNNISYDLDNVATGKWEQRPEYVLKVRSTDCLGRSRLFEKLALAAGLEAVVIGGRVKSFEISPTHGMKYATISPNGVVYDSHSWNAIKINGNWQLIDVTAAGGKSKKQGRLEEGKPVDPYFFLTPASEFIYTHLPDEDRWQLLDTPISKQEHERMPLLCEGFFKYKLKLTDNKAEIQSIDGELAYNMDAPSSIAMCAELRQDGHKIEGQYVFSQRGTKNYEFYVVAPHAGAYILRILARSLKSRNTRWDWVSDSKIQSKAGKSSVKLPFAWDEFQLHQGYIFTPSSGTLESGRSQFFKVYIPNALSVGIQTGGHIVDLERDGEVFAGSVILFPGEVLLTARFPSQPDWNSGLVRYNAR